MGHVELFIKVGLGAVVSQGNNIRLNRNWVTPEKAECLENSTAVECVEHFINVGNSNIRNLKHHVQFLIVGCDPDTARLFWNAFRGA